MQKGLSNFIFTIIALFVYYVNGWMRSEARCLFPYLVFEKASYEVNVFARSYFGMV